jgi:hypothetical protein
VRTRMLTIALVGVLSTSGCTAFSESLGGAGGPSGAASGPSAAPDAGQVGTVAPEETVTALADPDPVETAAAMSRTLVERSPVVVVARVDDRAGLLLGSSAAVGLGVPLLLEPEGDAVSDVLASELDRLGVDAVLAVGEADGRGLGSATTDDPGRVRHDVVSVPATPDAVAEATGLDLGPPQAAPSDGETAAVAALDPAAPVALQPDDAPPTADAGVDGELPQVARGDPVAGTVVLATEGPESVAAVATARATGAPVVVTEQTDPRASEAVLEALADADADAVVAVGSAWAGEAGLDWKVATALAGDELPGGGQLLFPGRMLVALYGSPGSPALGVLGEQGLEASIERAREHAGQYEDLVDPPVVPAFEIIATVASSAAGPDGNYSAESDPEALRPWVEAAGEAGLYVLLDLQPGRTDFVTQAERYRSLLELPHVGLALDPEWRLGPDEVHLEQVGSVGVDEVNRVVGWLADLTREHALPQKLLVLHQFRLAMLPERERLDTSREELALMVHVDGQGSQGDKQATWRAVRENAPPGLAWGWKNFYDEDQPMLTPPQTVAQVDPRPELVTYQ